MLRDGTALTPPSRCLRVLVYLSVLLVLFSSIAQAAHHHGSWTDGAQVRVLSNVHTFVANESDVSELTCPLCMVSHSVLPSFPALIARLNFCAAIASFVLRTMEPRGFWSYDLFSRPPPQA
jgi:hypothetical protein